MVSPTWAQVCFDSPSKPLPETAVLANPVLWTDMRISAKVGDMVRPAGNTWSFFRECCSRNRACTGCGISAKQREEDYASTHFEGQTATKAKQREQSHTSTHSHTRIPLSVCPTAYRRILWKTPVRGRRSRRHHEENYDRSCEISQRG